MKKWGIFLISYFTSFGAVSFCFLFLRYVKPSVFDPNVMFATATSIFVNLLTCTYLLKKDVPLLELWIRRILWIGEMGIVTPVIFILFDCVSKGRYLRYFVMSMIVVEFVVFVIYLIADGNTTRATLKKINEQLKKNNFE